MEKIRKVELLSPAGNEEGFYGAVHAGADAVYLAGSRFGARAYADNFTTESLVACIRYAHLLGRKIYLTVNTLLKEEELSQLYDYLAPFYEAGLDAVIVQDLGVLRFVREHFPKLKLHVSTQMTLCGSYGAALLKRMGAARIVPARELGLRELAVMKQRTDIEIEAFIHGAMCYCYSGQCLFSSILGGRSGNRGRCAQPCRLPYSVSIGNRKENECYPLSLKDMCTIEHLPAFIEAGIDSFKIEGRMKKPEYAAGVTAIYRRYIDLYGRLKEDRGPKEAAAAYHVDRADLEQLKSLYIRSGIQDGYYFRRNGREMITLESPAYSGSSERLLEEIRGTHLQVREKLPVSVKAVFRVGLPAEATYTWADRSFRVAGAMVEHAGKQPITSENIRKQLGKLGDSAFRIADMDIIVDEDSFYPLKQINELRRAAIAGLEEEILSAGGYSACTPATSPESETISQGICSDEPEAVGQDICSDEPEAVGQDICSDEPEAVSQGICSDEPEAVSQDICSDEPDPGKALAVSVSTISQLKAAADWFSGEKAHRKLRFYIDGDLFLSDRQKVLDIYNNIPAGSSFYLALPYILRESDRSYLETLSSAMTESGIFRGFLVRSMDGLGFVREFMEKGKLHCRTDAGVYAWNRWAVRELASFAEGFCLPYELRGSEQKALTDGLPCEKIVYGRIPMMITSNCLFRTFRQCRRKDEAPGPNLQCNGRRGRKYTDNEEYFLDSLDNQVRGKPAKPESRSHGSTEGENCRMPGEYAVPRDRYYAAPEDRSHAVPGDRAHAVPQDRHHAVLKDRYRREFPVAANCLHCMNIIYNTVPLSLYQMISRWEGRVDLRMDFTLESADEVTALLDAFLKGAPFPQREYTTGHEKRGVE